MQNEELQPMPGAPVAVTAPEYFEKAWNSCLRKIPYSKKAAVAARKKMCAKTGGIFDEYKCSFCGDWHIGHRLGTKMQYGTRKFYGTSIMMLARYEKLENGN